MIRGINRQDIFYCDNDRYRYLSTIKRFCHELKIDIITYCLMSNHVHLLVYAKSDLDLFVKKISSSYVYYFNLKYDRIGHLFQDRFKSEPIETDGYLLTVARYILQNPQKAGICKMQNYFWNSWNDIQDNSGISKFQILVDIMENYNNLIEFLTAENEDICMDIENTHGFTEEDALNVVKKIIGTDNPMDIVKLPPDRRKSLLAEMKKAGLSIRQISRLTGINRNVIQRA